MKLFKIIFWLLWRIWFYVLMGVIIVVLFPLLFISVLKESWYPYFFKLARVWAKLILLGMGFYKKLTILQKMELNKSYMFIANHTSMTDIMLMLSIVKNPFVFVGKKELAAIPLFGFFYKRTCILVDRNSPKSRNEVFKRAQQRINQGLSICIFPEGRVPDDEQIVLDEFKDGAFRLAIEHNLTIVPLVFADNKKRFSYTFMSGSPGIMRAMILPFIKTDGTTINDKKTIKEAARTTILNQLEVFNETSRN